MVKDLNKYFSKEAIQVANRYVKKMLNIRNHQGNVNQMTVRYHLTPGRIAVIKTNKQKVLRMWRN